jgi:hypothetical protein
MWLLHRYAFFFAYTFTKGNNECVKI